MSFLVFYQILVFLVSPTWYLKTPSKSALYLMYCAFSHKNIETVATIVTVLYKLLHSLHQTKPNRRIFIWICKLQLALACYNKTIAAWMCKIFSIFNGLIRWPDSLVSILKWKRKMHLLSAWRFIQNNTEWNWNTLNFRFSWLNKMNQVGCGLHLQSVDLFLKCD